MKYLTLNIHSWMEENQLTKFEEIAAFILKENIDVIALQEVNQSIGADVVNDPLHFISPKNEEVTIKEDNAGLVLVTLLKDLGCDYYWSWSMCHIGYGKYDEGICLLSKEKMETSSLLISEKFDIVDYRRRKVLLGRQTIASREHCFVSCHFSWWQKENTGFKYEWDNLLKSLPLSEVNVVLLGDFNNPANISDEGYDLIRRDFYDTYSLAHQKLGDYTIPPNIDGWKNSQDNLRVDYIWVNKMVPVASSKVVFDGVGTPIVSDHFGVLVEVC